MRDPDAYLVSRLRFKHLALVEALEAEGSIRKAARRLHVSEPAVSKALAEIEESFGFALFERSAAGVDPTARGEAVVEGARLLLNALRNVRHTAAQAERRWTLRLGAAPFVGLTLLPALLHALRREADDVNVTVREGPGPEMLRALVDGEIDAMLMSMSQDVAKAQRAATLVYVPIATVQLSIIVCGAHRLARRRKVSWSELADESWILPPAPSVVETAIRTVFLAQGVVPPEPRIRTASPPTNLALVAAGLGVGAVPTPVVEAVGVRGTIVRLPVSPMVPLPPVSLVYHSAAADSRAIRVLERAIEAARAA
ncbi:MAG: LysR family transcriptional regulator [Burkholderiales bacterium]|jgi:DNA-binding transcriptional LysR family regulator